MTTLTQLGQARAKVEYLAVQLGLANTHLHLFQRLTGAQRDRFKHEMYKSLDFWHYTIIAHIHTAIACLCRVYDCQEDTSKRRSLHLLRFLQQVDEASLTADERRSRKLDLDFLQKENPKAGTVPHPAVAKLRLWRNKLIAHRDCDLSPGRLTQFLLQHPADLVEIQFLVDRGFGILERWKRHHGCEAEFKRFPSGKDDYKFVLNSLRLGLNVQADKSANTRDPKT